MSDDDYRLLELLLLAYVAKKVIDKIPAKTWNKMLDKCKKRVGVER